MESSELGLDLVVPTYCEVQFSDWIWPNIRRNGNMERDLTPMVNEKELEICKVRGHDRFGLGSYWQQCKWCGIWLREVRTTEEREDTPPEDEQHPLIALQRRSEETTRVLEFAEKKDGVAKQSKAR